MVKRLVSRRRGVSVGAFLLCLLAPSIVWAETRSLKIYYIHTKEKAEIAYKKDGRYLESGLKKLNYLLRDWRRNEPTNMDPRLFDLIWQVYRLSGSRDYIHVVSAYRSPATNNMLRSRSASSGVAKNSQHTLGKALDFYLPDVNLAKLRGLGLKQEGGGVGYYPTSGSPFIHMDVGSVRHWPRMNRKELMALFPDGKTIHVPNDGKPLEGYNQALASYNARKGAIAPIVVAKEPQREKPEKKSLFAGLFGKKNTKDKQETTTKVARSETTAPTSPLPDETRIILPESDAPIPSSSPLKQAPGNIEVREDKIGALLIADATLPQNQAPPPQTPLVTIPELGSELGPELGFVPVPVLKTLPPVPNEESIFIAQQDVSTPVQTAYVPSLSRAQPMPPPPLMKQITEPTNQEVPKQETVTTVIAHADTIIPLPIDAFHQRTPHLKQGDALGTQDLVTNSDHNASDDFAAIDRETIRTIIADAMVLAEADRQMVASITPRTTPKADRPKRDELAQLIAQDEAQRQIESYANREEVHQIPELVFVSGLQKDRKKPVIAKLDGKAISFPPVARISGL